MALRFDGAAVAHVTARSQPRRAMVAANGGRTPPDGRGPLAARLPPLLGQGGAEEVEREPHEEASSDLCMCPIDFYSGYFSLHSMDLWSPRPHSSGLLLSL